jgi:putative peptidoglycan lipid II flippase
MLAIDVKTPRNRVSGRGGAYYSAPVTLDETESAAAGSAPGSEPERRRRLGISTIIFSVATGLSRVAGLIREIVAASYFGVTGAMSAFTIAFQVPNLIRALFADSALQGAFVPVFAELLEKGQKKEAFKVASALLSLITVVLGSVTLIFILLAEPIMSLFTPGFDDQPELVTLTAGLSQVMFPIVMLLALSGVTVGMLNTFEKFSVPALAPIAWNLVIILSMVGLTPLLDPEDQIYSYAIGVLLGTIVQFVLPLPWLRGTGGRFTLTFNWRNPHVKRVLVLMVPVTIALGLINFSLLINSFVGTLVSEEVPAALDKAFRIYMLPQGLFSVAIATVLFPRMSRLASRGATDDLRGTMANGMRQILLTLVPSAVIIAVLADPITQLVYQRGKFDAGDTDLVATALFWWAFSLPAQGASLLLSRTFFALQRPWVTTALSGGNLVVNLTVALALYKPFGISGIVIGTVVGTLGMAGMQAFLLRRDIGGLEGPVMLAAFTKIAAASALLGVVSYGVWWVLNDLLGESLAAQIVSVGGGVLTGVVAYGAAVWAMRLPEAVQIWNLFAGRLRRGRSA